LGALCACLLFLAFFVLQSPVVPAQAPGENQQAREGPLQYALGKVKAIAEKIAEFQDPVVTIRSLSTLAQSICAHDPALARQVFLQAGEVALIRDQQVAM
jgi:hypothetical protein